jgi:hypothetical protein
LDTKLEAIENLSNPLAGPRELALDTLCDYIESAEVELNWLTETLLPALLEITHIGLGEQNTPSVYGRSFALLVLASLVERDTESTYLSDSEHESIVTTTLQYLMLEKDFRGYVSDDEGWAHSVAHVADLTSELIQNPTTSNVKLDELLQGWVGLLKQPTLPALHYDEEQRMALALKRALNGGQISPAVLSGFFEDLLDDSNELWYQTAFQKPILLNRFCNAKNLVNALYLQCKLDAKKPAPEEVLEVLVAVLRKLDSGYYSG